MNGMSHSEVRAARIKRLQSQWGGQWGCAGRHHGIGTEECPRGLHHHHDMFCRMPIYGECVLAGVPYQKVWPSRA